MTPNQKKLDTYQAGNQAAAAVVLESPEKYGGEESLLVRWARLVLERAENPLTIRDRVQLPFRTEAA